MGVFKRPPISDFKGFIAERLSDRIPQVSVSKAPIDKKRAAGKPFTQWRQHNVDLERAMGKTAAPSAANMKAIEKNVNIIKNYNILPKDAIEGKSDEEVANLFVNHLRDNIKYLYNKSKKDWGGDTHKLAGDWYVGANKIVKKQAQKYGLHHRSVAALYAALSPQLAWDKNVSLGDRILDIAQNKKNHDWTPEMTKWGKGYFKDTHSGSGKLFADMAAKKKKFSDLTTPEEKAVFIRARDEAHGDRGFKIVHPSGQLGDWSTRVDKKTNEPVRNSVGWTTFDMIGKAVQAITRDPKYADKPHSEGSIKKISSLMGDEHKIRSFYNNLVDPHHGKQGDVTVDTHAVGAALLKPIGGKSKEAAAGLGRTPARAVAKGKGLYGYYADAYRRAAKDLNVRPRQTQSVSWEAIKSLFSPQKKNLRISNKRDKEGLSVPERVKQVWSDYSQGKRSVENTRKNVVNTSLEDPRLSRPLWANKPPVAEENMETFKQFLNRPTPKPKTIAKRKKVSVSAVDKAIKKGTGVEKEHTKKKAVAKEIATDHVGELGPGYYPALDKMEKKLKKGKKKD